MLWYTIIRFYSEGGSTMVVDTEAVLLTADDKKWHN